MKLIGIAAVLATAAVAGPIYTITDLGSLGGVSAQAFGLSSTGQAVGTATTVFGHTHGFTSSGSGIADLTAGTSASEGQAAAVNGSGQIVGTQIIGGHAFATVWNGGAAQSITGSGSYGMAINEAGEVAGMIDGHAFRTVNGAIEELGALSGGDWSSAYAINNAGELAGYGDIGGGAFRAFVWSPDAGYTVLGTFGGKNSYAMAINAGGQAAGTAQLSSGYTHAFLWSAGILQDLGTLGGGSSYAYGLNSAGDVVGYSWLRGGAAPHAFLFQDGVMLDLNGLIDPGSSWVLTQAFAINGNGQIAGAGLLDGVEHAFRLDYEPGFSDTASVPEPATWIVVFTGLLGARMKSWRKITTGK